MMCGSLNQQSKVLLEEIKCADIKVSTIGAISCTRCARGAELVLSVDKTSLLWYG